MLTTSLFLDFCKINYTRESLSKLDKIVSAFMITHIHKWLEKLTVKVEKELSFECPACYTDNTGEFKKLEKLLQFDVELENDQKIIGKERCCL